MSLLNTLLQTIYGLKKKLGPATYSIAVSSTGTPEGGTVTYTVTTKNIPSGTTLYWTNSGTTSAGDFTSAANSGSFIISNNIGTIVFTLSNDQTTEGSETIIIEVRTGSTSGPVVATAATVTVSDTSILSLSVDILVVAGGGGGGGSTSGTTFGAGGGAGGLIATTRTISPGITLSPSVGGGGGGGGYNSGGKDPTGGASGIIIIRYAGSQIANGGSVSSSGGYTYHTFTTGTNGQSFTL